MCSSKYVLILVALVALCIFFFYQSESISKVTLVVPKTTESTQKNIHMKNIFEKKDNMRLYNDLCLEPGTQGIQLVAYNQLKDGVEKISVKAGQHYKLGKMAKWTIHLTTSSMPKKSNYLYEDTAFFVTTTCGGNLHHFWIDTVNGLFGAMRAMKALGSKNLSQLYYMDDPWAADKTNGCHDPARFQDILYALSIKKEHVCYKHAVPHTCFANAVFGFYGHGFSLTDKRDYFKRFYNITCPPSDKLRVTIINRNHRTIVNAEELQEAANRAGFDASITYLSNISIRDQFKVMICTDILVGLQGAGLRWIDFLPPKKSALLELTWKHWGTVYVNQAKSQGKKAASLSARNVELNLPVYFKIVKKSEPTITPELINKYNKKGPRTEADNHWKYADGTFDPQKFVEKLKLLKP